MVRNDPDALPRPERFPRFDQLRRMVPVGGVGVMLLGAVASAAALGLVGTIDGSLQDELGLRDGPWRSDTIPTIQSRVGCYMTSEQVAREPTQAATRAVESVGTGDIWLHIDLDVLARSSFHAYGGEHELKLPGGLTWPQLLDCARTVVQTHSCVGVSVAIYNPKLDTTGEDGPKVVAFIGALVEMLT
jgi:hypothetical protein